MSIEPELKQRIIKVLNEVVDDYWSGIKFTTIDDIEEILDELESEDTNPGNEQ